MYSYPSSGSVRSRLSYWTRYPYKPRFGQGLFFGWAGASALSLVVIRQAIGKHSTYFPQYHIALGKVLLGYWIAGTALGLVVAFAHPLARSRVGSFLLGLALGWLTYAITGFVGYGWDSTFLLICFVPGVIAGGGLGVVFYDEEHPRLSRRRAPRPHVR